MDSQSRIFDYHAYQVQESATAAFTLEKAFDNNVLVHSELISWQMTDMPLYKKNSIDVHQSINVIHTVFDVLHSLPSGEFYTLRLAHATEKLCVAQTTFYIAPGVHALCKIVSQSAHSVQKIFIHVQQGAQVTFLWDHDTAIMHVQEVVVHVAQDAQVTFKGKNSSSACIALLYKQYLHERGARIATTHTAVASGGTRVFDICTVHQAPHTTSESVYRLVLDNRASSTTKVKTHITNQAARGCAQQKLKTIFLDAHSRDDAKPIMLVDTHSVEQAQHEYATSVCDEHMVWYCALRGINKEQTCQIIVDAFINVL